MQCHQPTHSACMCWPLAQRLLCSWPGKGKEKGRAPTFAFTDWKWQYKAKRRCKFALKPQPSRQSRMSAPCNRRLWLHGAGAVGAWSTRGAPLAAQMPPELQRVSPQIPAEVSQYACARRGFQLRAGAALREGCVGD